MDIIIVCKRSSHLIEKYSHMSLIDAMLMVWMLMVNINYLSFFSNINLNFDINSNFDVLDQVKLFLKSTLHKNMEGHFKDIVNFFHAKEMPTHGWWKLYGFETLELQKFVVKFLEVK